MQPERAVELGRVGHRELAAQRGIGGVGVGYDRVQSVGGAALDHEDEAPVGLDVGEHDTRRDQHGAEPGAGDAKELAAVDHGHLL